MKISFYVRSLLTTFSSSPSATARNLKRVMESNSLYNNFMNESEETLISFGSLEGHDAERCGCKCFRSLHDCFSRFYHDLRDYAKKALEVRQSDSRKIIFAIKMGLALALASLLIFLEVSFTDLGQYSIWAILTVVVMFEFSIGATIIKGFNRGLGTLCAGILAFFFAELSMLAGKWEKAVIVLSFIITGSFASYFKLYPTMAPYEYGYRVFVLTYCILMMAGNRSQEYVKAILTRLVLIAFGAAICFIVNISIYPIWAGDDLHRLVVKNFKDLANSLEGCVDGYLKGVEYERIPSKFYTYQDFDDPLYQGYRSVIESKSREQTLLGFAIWEPPHGPYRMCNYPWKNYVRLNGALRHCALMVMALHGCIMSEIQAPIEKRNAFHDEFHKVGSEGAKVLRKLGIKVEKMENLSNDDILKEVHEAAEQLQCIIDKRSYLLVNTERWGVSRQPQEMEDHGNFSGENCYQNLQMGTKSLSETVINLRSPNVLTSSPTNGLLKQACRKHIPWPSPLPLDDDDDGLVKEDEIRTYESASACALSLAAFASTLIEIVARLQNVVDSFEEISEKAEFKEPLVNTPLAASSSFGFWSRLLRFFRFKN